MELPWNKKLSDSMSKNPIFIIYYQLLPGNVLINKNISFQLSSSEENMEIKEFNFLLTKLQINFCTCDLVVSN